MPPTRTAKKPKSSKLPTQASSSSTARRKIHRENVPDSEIPRSGTEDIVASQDGIVEDGRDVSGMGGGGVSEKAVADVIGDVMEAQKKRHSAAQASIRKTYERSVAETKTAITHLFDKYDEEANTAHAAQMAELQRLIGQKREIEAAMQKRVANLQRAYVVLATVVGGVYQARVAQL
ncbi:uncharacterized protein EI97DRAFT_463345 [Westerdykella ornata]|uniref:Uncharacterized protein n=1 Tax=Westerdykella ornata TaxID=318751 RepID=A0A6A6JWC1_WESOR|nr:uncharacterized protein EI97DRAFT_463345 [Westerdykella ornata]KAF2280920.1 hypothetical protein EI97DRAFT_463345 [Westerdykella ornata]